MWNGYAGMCASRSGLTLPSVLQEQACSPEFGLASMVAPSLGLQTPNHPISPAELFSSCVDVTSPQANGQEASIDEKPAFSHRPAYRRRMLAALPTAVHPSRCHAISGRGSRSLVVPNTSPRCTLFGRVRGCLQALEEILRVLRICAAVGPDFIGRVGVVFLEVLVKHGRQLTRFLVVGGSVLPRLARLQHFCRHIGT